MKFGDRYSSAIRSSDLRVHNEVDGAPVDLVGAAGMASRHRRLPLALMRLVAGDKHAAREVVGMLADKVVSKAHALSAAAWPRADAEALSRAVVAYAVHPHCPACRGRGFLPVPGAPALSGHACAECHGTRRRDFDGHFDEGRLEVARWLLAEIEADVNLAQHLAQQRLREQGAST